MSASKINPPHYTRGGVETIDFIEAKGLGYHLGNVVKYVSRCGYKETSIEGMIDDLEKARWYLDRQIENLRGGYEDVDDKERGDRGD